MARSYGGAKVGHRIGAIVSQYIVSTQTKMTHLKHKLAMAIFSSISDVISEETHEALGPMLRKMHGDLNTDSVSHSLVEFMATRHGQLQAGAGISMAAGSILGSLAQIVNNELAPSVRGLLESNPHLLPDPGTIAELAAAGLAGQNDAVQNISQQGINAGWANALIELNKQYPDSATMLDMMRKGLITRDIFVEWSIRSKVPIEVAQLLANLIDVPLSPADAALAVLRGNITMSDGAAAAAKWGVSADTFDTLIGNTGEPLALMQLLEAYRRGFIDKQRLVKGILQSRIRDEWVDVAEQLRFSPMSVSDATNAVVQNHITQSTGAAISEQNGLEPGAFDILVQTAGEPLSRTEMEELFNRQLVTRDQVIQALRESRLKDKYGELAFQLHDRLIPVNVLSDAIVYGAISLQDAVSKAMEHGYGHDSATVIVSAGSNRKMESYRRAVVASVETLYVDSSISKDDAKAVIATMGFDHTEADLILEAAEYKRQGRIRSAAITAVRNKLIAHRINAQTATGLLDSLGVPSTERDGLLSLWETERMANVRPLSEAQIVKAFRMKLPGADEPWAMAYLQQLGYSEFDAALLLVGA